MFARFARILTVVALGLTAGLTIRAHAALMTPGTADTRVPATIPVVPQVCTSGIAGTVVVRTGDLMPPLDPSRAKIVPASAPLYVFAGNACVATIQSGADGRFQLALPPGRYAIVAQVVGAAPVARTVQVREDQWTELDIHFDLHATY